MMNEAGAVMVTILHVFVAVTALFLARAALRQSGRVRRLATRTIGSLTGGAAEVSGRLVAESPIATLDGPLAAVLRTEIELAYHKGSKTYRDPWANDRVLASPCTIEDASGTLDVRIDRVLPVAASKQHTFTPEHLQAQRPDLWQLVVGKHENITEVRVRETYVPHDITVFASGELEAADKVEEGSDYRGTRAKLRLHGTEGQPLILSPLSEKEVRAQLLRPATLLFWTVFLSCLVIAILWYVRAAIIGLAGIG